MIIIIIIRTVQLISVFSGYFEDTLYTLGPMSMSQPVMMMVALRASLLSGAGLNR